MHVNMISYIVIFFFYCNSSYLLLHFFLLFPLNCLFYMSHSYLHLIQTAWHWSKGQIIRTIQTIQIFIQIYQDAFLPFTNIFFHVVLFYLTICINIWRFMSNILYPNYFSFYPSLVQYLDFHNINTNEIKKFEIAW